MPQTQVNPKEQNADREFIAEQLPAWLSNATPRQLNTLRSKVAAHHASQRRVAAVTRQLQPLHTFAKQQLEQAMQARMGLTLDLDQATWREERRRLKIVQGTVREFTSYFVRVPALQKMMQNFKEAESFFSDTALVQAAQQGASGEATLSSDIDGLVSLCRQTDVGAAYQRHLAQVLTSDFERDLVADKRCELALALEIAAMKPAG